MKKTKRNKEINEIVCLKEADKIESTPAQSYPDLPPGEPSSHVHEWPQETVPYPIARAMEFCSENCRIAQCSKESTNSSDLIQQRCRFPLHCAIVFRTHKP